MYNKTNKAPPPMVKMTKFEERLRFFFDFTLIL